MNGLALKQLFELGIMIAAAVIYVALHYACSGLAIAISGRKSGLIRGFLQGTLLCGVFAIAEVFLLNGAIKWYHIFAYALHIFLFMKVIAFIKTSIVSAKKAKIEKVKTK